MGARGGCERPQKGSWESAAQGDGFLGGMGLERHPERRSVWSVLRVQWRSYFVFFREQFWICNRGDSDFLVFRDIPARSGSWKRKVGEYFTNKEFGRTGHSARGGAAVSNTSCASEQRPFPHCWVGVEDLLRSVH